eukprot:TRINITY_DN227_c0_g1_i1.p2 TRINITY_DN227_c0_g1~~TRINITY_DN227_c0_g1_i1.p2  ORF type:complete len:168 (-),score=52.23 TRINITY_DN227_c0_g1_i1:90-593(-)
MFATRFVRFASTSVPKATLIERKGGNTTKLAADELFSKGKFVVFGVPGAFTPVCSTKHVPSFLQNADAIKAKGVTDVACVSINDPFVMEAWGNQLGAPEKGVRLLADPSGEFTKALDLATDLSAAGLGLRSKRYSMIIENGQVKKVNIEDSPGDFKVSTAENILSEL